jgi:ribosomal protein S18 acetylase RimI-like enzyme
MDCEIRQMTLADYPEVSCLWTQAEGMSLGEDDNREGIALCLERNQGLCFVALVGGNLIGTVLCGHDGRRGIMRHLAVQKEFRNQGIALLLVQKSLAALSEQGIKKCNIFVLDDNVAGLKFWEHIGFHHLADDHSLLQLGTDANPQNKTKLKIVSPR